MKLFSGLYVRAMQWARHKYATYWLAIVSFTEASFFLVPPDVMLAPMSLARPDKAWFYATVTTVTSVAGGIFGYVLGVFAFSAVEPYLLEWGYMDAYYMAQQWFMDYGFWAILLAGWFTPVPYKIFTIAGGAAGMALIPFIVGSLIGRGSRYFIVAGLMKWGGAPLEQKLHQLADRIGWATIILAIFVYLIFFR